MTISLRAIVAAAIATAFVALRAAAQDAPAPAKSPAVAENKAPSAAQPEAGVAKQNNINIRGQAKINSEVIGHLQKNDPVIILEEIALKKPKQDEPARWFRISLPTNVTAWVNSSFLEEGKVKPRRLNVRGGPGENYSILGRIEKGTAVTVIETKGDWTRIEPPTNAFGFVAAHLVERTPAPAIAAAKTEPPKLETPKTEPPPPVVAEVTPTTPAIKPAEPVAAPATNTTEAAVPPVPVPAITPAPAEAVPTPVEKVKKIVTREGILKGSVSIQAPTYFELRNVFTGDAMNYVFSPSTNLVLKEYKGKRVIVTGEELLDERWQNTPVIIVDALQTVD